ncbi:putative coil containing protein [Vibrio phage 424E50-1]|nr:putative coil containing protein [Vibrio phage 424E50-1]
MAFKNIDQTSLGVSRLTSFLQDSENVKKFLGVCLEEIKELSDALLVLAGQKDITVVEGVWLDFIGSVVGIPRNGVVDEEYRRLLLLKISINTANGTHPSTSQILKNFTLSDNIKIFKGFLSYGQVVVDGDFGVDFSLWELLQEIIPVTTAVTILHDTKQASFFPAWERTGEVIVTDFQLHDTDNLEVASDTGFVTDLLSVTVEDPTSIAEISNTDRWLLGWQDSVNITLQDEEGDALLLLQEESGDDLLAVQGAYHADITDVYLPWEINEHCVQSFPVPQSFEELVITINSLTDYLNNKLVLDFN